MGPLFDDPFPHLPQQGVGRVGFEFDQAILVLAGIDAGAGFQKGEGFPFFLRDAQANAGGTVLFEGGIDVL